jgi:hypothetical protein
LGAACIQGFEYDVLSMYSMLLCMPQKAAVLVDSHTRLCQLNALIILRFAVAVVTMANVSKVL